MEGDGVQWRLEEAQWHGRDLKRPECVLCTADGGLVCADWNGGVSVIAPSGETTLVLTSEPVGGGLLKPNGVAIDADGSFVVAHLDDHHGGVFRLKRDGGLEPMLTEIDGAALPPTNFVLRDWEDGWWITVSTRIVPRFGARRPGVADGLVIRMDRRGARIVADDVGFANEVRIDPSRRVLYIVETFGRRIARAEIRADGGLGPRETFVELGPDEFPDGIAFDAEGALWVACVLSNRVLRITPDRVVQTVIADQDPDYLARIAADFDAGRLAEPGVLSPPERPLGNLSSIAFGGPGRRAYLGCLDGDRIASFAVPITGAPPPHW